MKTAILKVGKKSTGGEIKHTDPGGFGYVFKCAIAAVSIESIWETRGLTNIKIIASIVVEVANRDTVVTVNVDADCAIEIRPPVVGPVKELLSVGSRLP